MSQANYSSSKSKYVYLGAFLTPIVLLGIIVICGGAYPFGDNCILKTDFYHQYAPFFSEFRDKLQHGGSLKFTWDLGMGVNFIAIIAYYLASPFNLLIYFVNESHTIEFMTVMIILKAGFAALGMALYLKHRAPGEDFGAYIFSLFYALSGYYCAYYWNIMWLDSIAVFPLIMLGAERLISGKSGALYGAALGYCILCNYYIAIPICLFLVVYFFAFGVLTGYDSVGAFFKTGLRFTLWSLVAGGIAAALLIPEIYALSATASSESNFPQTFSEYFSIFDMLARHMAGVETEQWLKHYPNIYCGSFVYLLFVLYVISKRISLKEKVIYISLSFFLLAGFAINVLNFIWHGLRYPNSLPARQSFIYCFLVIYMCFRAYGERKNATKRDVGTAAAVSFAFILLAQKLIDNDEFHFAVFYGALLLTAIYAGLLHLYRSEKIAPVTAALIVGVIAIAELATNTAVTSFTVTSRSAYIKNNDEIKSLVDEVREEDNGLYRFERITRKTKDDGAWLNFPSVSLFSSMANADCSKFFKAVGCESSTNAYSITGSTPLMDMLFGVKYGIYGKEQSFDDELELAAHKENIYIYRRKYTLPIGYVLPQRAASGWMTELDDPILVQNSLCDSLGVGQVLKPVQSVVKDGSVTKADISEDGEYYAYSANAKTESVTVSKPDSKKTYEHLDRRYLIELGDLSAGDSLEFSSDDGGDTDIRVYKFDYEVLSDIYDKMSAYTLKVTDYGDDYIKGTVDVDTAAAGYGREKALMLITTPYDEGWTVKLDGEPVALYKGLDTFVSFYVGDGEHSIEMSYEPRGLKLGLMITAISLAILVAAAIAGWVMRRRTEHVSHAQSDECIGEAVQEVKPEEAEGAGEDAEDFMSDITEIITAESGEDIKEETIENIRGDRQ